MAWWTLWLVGNFAVNFAARSYTGAETAEELRTGTILYMVSDAMSVAGALLAIVVLRRATGRLDARAATAPTPAPPEPESDLAAPERPTGAPA